MVDTPPSLHRYLYAYANPTVYIDLNGYESVPCYGICGNDRTADEQAQYEAAREAERQALLNQKSEPEPSKPAKPQSGHQGSQIAEENEHDIGTLVDDAIDWTNKKREAIKEAITNAIVDPYEEAMRKTQEAASIRNGVAPDIAAQDAQARSSAAADKSREEARKVVDSAEEGLAGGAAGKVAGAAGAFVAGTKRAVKFKRWKSGDAIDKPMPDGSAPSWDVVRSRYWKNRASASNGEFSRENLARMKQGNAPLDYNSRTGKFEPRELHHVEPQRAGGGNGPLNLRELTPDQHGAVDPFRHTVPTTTGIK
jgi:hypothetical protein